MVWYGMVWYGMVWYGMVWYGMVWCGMLLCYVQLEYSLARCLWGRKAALPCCNRGRSLVGI